MCAQFAWQAGFGGLRTLMRSWAKLRPHIAPFLLPFPCSSQAITTWKDLGSVTAAEEYVQQVIGEGEVECSR